MSARRSGDRPDGPLVMALHGDGQDIDEFLTFVATLSPARELVAPVGCWGTYVGAMDLSSYTWFHEVPGVPEPDPVSFGRSLLDVEQLIRSLRAPAGSPPVVLVGAGQGASIALAMNAVIPEALAAVVAIGGRPVALPDGAVPDPSESEQAPSLWLAGQGEQERAEAAGTLSDSASMGTPSVVPMPEGKVFGDAVRDEVKGWIGRSVQHAGANSA